jgi:ABC-2 type transport system permease protein
MTMWRLEFLRLWRTQRWLILLAVFVSFGLLGPLTARYLPALMESIGEDAVGSLPAMGPPDGITQYIGNAAQIGLLAVAFVAAAGLAFDAKLEIAVFLRTRASVRNILTPRLVLTASTAVGAFAVGMVVAYVGTGILLAWLDLPDVIVGSLLFALYLVFAVVLIGFVSSLLRSVPAIALLSVGVLIGIGLLSLVSSIAPWLPSALVGAIDTLIRGGGFDYWRAIVVTVALIAGMVILTLRRLDHREL